MPRGDGHAARTKPAQGDEVSSESGEHDRGGGAYPDWETIYRDNVRWVYARMFARTGNRPDAEDLTAEVFLAALRPLRVSAPAPEVRAYLLATVRTVLAAHWRRTFGLDLTSLDPGCAEPAADVSAPAPPGAAQAWTEAILAELPDRYRKVLELRFLAGCSVREAAAELGVNDGAARVLQHRALRRAAEIGWRMERG
jgi:RNA polymerase sigma factor (sigma-70 family)